MESNNLSWWKTKAYPNWGDVLNPVLFEYISGEKAIFMGIGNSSNIHRYLCIGSILPSYSTNAEIWGSGFMDRPWPDSQLVAPKKIHAVRGPQTREVFLDRGIECPEVYGDPALLLPRYYFPKIEKKYKLGIIPHYVDQDNEWIEWKKNLPYVKIIDILSGVHSVVDEILSCEMIISSSLHGIIAADAYGVPNKWVEFSDKVGGGGFKFRDYFKSVGRKDRQSIRIDGHKMLKNIYPEMQEVDLHIDLDLLLSSCPFQKKL